MARKNINDSVGDDVSIGEPKTQKPRITDAVTYIVDENGNEIKQSDAEKRESV